MHYSIMRKNSFFQKLSKSQIVILSKSCSTNTLTYIYIKKIVLNILTGFEICIHVIKNLRSGN